MNCETISTHFCALFFSFFRHFTLKLNMNICLLNSVFKTASAEISLKPEYETVKFPCDTIKVQKKKCAKSLNARANTYTHKHKHSYKRRK